jgi:2'-5' RNA ligase
MRLFIAVHFSDEVKKVLLQSIKQLKDQADGGNFTRPENLHLTLAFLGETGNIAGAKRAIDRSVVPEFSMTVGGFGHFGSLYWVGIRPNPVLTGLAKNLQSALRAEGFRIENREFRPHITLARELRSPRPPRLEVPEISMAVGRVSLMKSERIAGKLTYTEIYGKPL